VNTPLRTSPARVPPERATRRLVIELHLVFELASLRRMTARLRRRLVSRLTFRGAVRSSG
jgi:hypothetical protein